IAYGTGIDPNSVSPYFIPAVDSGGGNYSFRLGDGVPGGTGTNPNYARAEAIRFTFNVTTTNSFFTYKYAAFLQDPGNLPEEQPRFEVRITRPDASDSLILNGYLKVVAGSSNLNCTGTFNFHQGAGLWKYSDWTTVSNDLTAYFGQNIAIEFRT